MSYRRYTEIQHIHVIDEHTDVPAVVLDNDNVRFQAFDDIRYPSCTPGIQAWINLVWEIVRVSIIAYAEYANVPILCVQSRTYVFRNFSEAGTDDGVADP